MDLFRKNTSMVKNFPTATESRKSDLAQWLATIANSTMLFGIGTMIGITITVIGQLHNNANSDLCLDDDQASWFGSLMPLIQPIGCMIAAYLQKFINRKAGMILMNILELLAWILLYYAKSVNALYMSVIMMGISAGYMAAPGLAFIGEISQPRIRGTLTSFANMNVGFGTLVELFLGSVFHWKTAAAISAVFPVISIIMVCCIPDSPVWLIGQGRKEEAMRALCWLRGWASESQVQAEFDELCKYAEASKVSIKESKNKIYIHVPTQGYIDASTGGRVEPEKNSKPAWRIKLSDVLRPSMMRPFRLIIGYEVFYHSAALSGLGPYMIETFSILNVPVKPQWLAFASAGVMLLGGIICIFTVRIIGKRVLSLISMTVCSASCLALGFYALYKDEINIPWIAIGLFVLLYFTTMIGIRPIPWMLMSEIFPYRGRSLGAGISAAAYFIFAFLFSKTYLNLQALIQLHGCFFLYGIVGFVGVIFLYVYLPETEGKSLSEVQDCFANKKPLDVETSAF